MKQSTFKKIARVVDAADCLNADFESFFTSYEIEDLESADEIFEILDENGAFFIDIIYYGNAMKYLTEHDPSLVDSLSLAEDMGYSPSDLNSEKLASILASQNAREEFDELMSDIEDIIDENE